MKILVLGCGPAGLLAAHAASVTGHDVKIASKKRKSEMFGAQYLHSYIPQIDAGPGKSVDYKLVGTAEGYRQKVYGNDWSGQVSPDALGNVHVAWNIRRAYDELWDLYGSYVIDTTFTREATPTFLRDNPTGADFVVNTIPAPVLCINPEHQFLGQDVWALGDAPERGVFNPVQVPPQTIVCNGEPDVGWYRTANVFGRSTTEWPAKRKPPVEGVAQVVKPLKTTCDCWPDVLRLGRYGKWEKGVLAHEAYYDLESKLLHQGVQGTLF